MTDHRTAELRVREYADSLRTRLAAQRGWRLRHPDIDPFNEDEYTDQLHADDPWPDTRDVLSSELFLAVVTVALRALDEARRG